LDKSRDKNNPDETPYEVLGISKDANFEVIQKAKDEKVKEAGDDLIAKAKIESSYDQILMGSLKARQLGSVSSDAQNASIKEKQNNQIINSPFPLLSKIKNLNKNSVNKTQNFSISRINTDSIDQLPTKLSIGLLFLIILFISPDQYNRLLLSLSTLILTYVQLKSGKKFIISLGWSVTFLSIGLIFGGFLETNTFIQEISNNSLSVQKIQSIPAVLILWLGIIFL